MNAISTAAKTRGRDGRRSEKYARRLQRVAHELARGDVAERRDSIVLPRFGSGNASVQAEPPGEGALQRVNRSLHGRVVPGGGIAQRNQTPGVRPKLD